MGSSSKLARMMELVYATALHDANLRPGEIAHLTCQTCSASFILELPAMGQGDVSLSLVLDGEVRVACTNHCLPQQIFAEFQPRRVVIPTSGWIENRHCKRYWTDTPASRCPVCGIENYREVLQRQVRKIHAFSDGVTQDVLINATMDLVAIFDGVMRAMVRGHAANLAHRLSEFDQTEMIESPASSNSVDLVEKAARLPQSISFQNLSGARKNLLEATCGCVQWHRGGQVETCPTGSDIEWWIANELGADAWHDATRVFQKRHLYQHGLGAVDAQYINKTGDHAFRIDQIVTIAADELAVTARVCTLISSHFFGYYLS